MDGIIEELSNSDQNLVLNKLMDYPVINGYNQINAKINGKAGTGNQPLFPDRIPVYLLPVSFPFLLILVQRDTQNSIFLFLA